jgi:hypothetical protein
MGAVPQQPSGHANPIASLVGASGHDPVNTYFECITSCSVDDGDCVTRCVEVLREGDEAPI